MAYSTQHQPPQGHISGDSEKIQLAKLFGKKKEESVPVQEASPTAIETAPAPPALVEIPSRPTEAAKNKQFQCDLQAAFNDRTDAITELGILVAKTPGLQSSFKITASDLSQAINPGGVDFATLGNKALKNFAIDGHLQKQVETLETALKNTNEKITAATPVTPTPSPPADVAPPIAATKPTFKEELKAAPGEFKKRWRERKGFDGKPVNLIADDGLGSEAPATAPTTSESTTATEGTNPSDAPVEKEHKIVRGVGRFAGKVVGSMFNASPLGIAKQGIDTVKEMNQESKVEPAAQPPTTSTEETKQ